MLNISATGHTLTINRPMKKTKPNGKRIDITNDYIKALHRFTQLVQHQRNTDVGDADYYTVYSQTGRKYDKVYLVSEGEEQLLFFVERATGTIYGRNNNIQPNLKWWFNTIYTAYLWDWREFPVPTKDVTVKTAWTYGENIKHYELRTALEINEALYGKETETPPVEALDKAVSMK